MCASWLGELRSDSDLVMLPFMFNGRANLQLVIRSAQRGEAFIKHHDHDLRSRFRASTVGANIVFARDTTDHNAFDYIRPDEFPSLVLTMTAQSTRGI